MRRGAGRPEYRISAGRWRKPWRVVVCSSLMWLSNVTLTGRSITLVPLAEERLSDLSEAVDDGELWRLWVTSVPRPEEVGEWYRAAIARRDERGDLPFAVVDRAVGRAIGTTRLCNPDEANRRLEIGYTWYAASRQRTGVNTEAKLLLLTHAFETLHCIAVELRTHRLNRRSRAAIERLGAQLDGILRNHRILSDGTYRDTAVYSITESEWPAVKVHISKLTER